MKKYIDKAKVVAEIESLFKKAEKSSGEYQNGAIHTLITLKDKLDTIEVKDVDLKKEFDDYTKNILFSDIQYEPFTHLYNCAKHFFELGLKTQKGE